MTKSRTAIKVPGNWALHRGPVGTVEPANSAEALDAGWVELGYTDDGVTFMFDRTIEDIEVDQSYWDIAKVVTKYDGTVKTVLAEYNRTNVEIAFDASVTEPVAESGEYRVTPATGGQLTEHALLLECLDTLASGDRLRRVIRRCIVADVGETKVQKALKQGLNLEFEMLGEDGVDPWYELANYGSLAAPA